jgi:hypothetical protein
LSRGPQRITKLTRYTGREIQERAVPAGYNTFHILYQGALIKDIGPPWWCSTIFCGGAGRVKHKGKAYLNLGFDISIIKFSFYKIDFKAVLRPRMNGLKKYLTFGV